MVLVIYRLFPDFYMENYEHGTVPSVILNKLQQSLSGTSNTLFLFIRVEYTGSYRLHIKYSNNLFVGLLHFFRFDFESFNILINFPVILAIPFRPQSLLLGLLFAFEWR